MKNINNSSLSEESSLASQVQNSESDGESQVSASDRESHISELDHESQNSESDLNDTGVTNTQDADHCEDWLLGRDDTQHHTPWSWPVGEVAILLVLTCCTFFPILRFHRALP